MAVVYSAGLKTTRMQAVADAIDAGAAGKLVIGTAGFAKTLVTITFSDPCGTVSGDTLTFDNTPALSATAGDTGTAAEAKLTTSADASVVTGLTVGTGSENIVLNSASVTSGQTVTITSAKLVHG